jgi:hypothetical protein
MTHHRVGIIPTTEKDFKTIAIIMYRAPTAVDPKIPGQQTPKGKYSGLIVILPLAVTGRICIISSQPQQCNDPCALVCNYLIQIECNAFRCLGVSRHLVKRVAVSGRGSLFPPNDHDQLVWCCPLIKFSSTTDAIRR